MAKLIYVPDDKHEPSESIGHPGRPGGIQGKIENGHQNDAGRQCHQTRQTLAKIRRSAKVAQYFTRDPANLAKQWEAAIPRSAG